VLVLEVKGGRIRFDETISHFISKNRDGTEYDIGDPFEQAMKNKKTLLEKMRSVSGWPGPALYGHAVALPDAVTQANWLRPNAPRELIIDALDLASLEDQLNVALTEKQPPRSITSYWSLVRGSKASRKPSPRKEKASTMIASTMAGSSVSQG